MRFQVLNFIAHASVVRSLHRPIHSSASAVSVPTPQSPLVALHVSHRVRSPLGTVHLFALPRTEHARHRTPTVAARICSPPHVIRCRSCLLVTGPAHDTHSPSLHTGHCCHTRSQLMLATVASESREGGREGERDVDA